MDPLSCIRTFGAPCIKIKSGQVLEVETFSHKYGQKLGSGQSTWCNIAKHTVQSQCMLTHLNF